MRTSIVFILLLALLCTSAMAVDILVKIDPASKTAFLRKTLQVAGVNFHFEPLVSWNSRTQSNWFIAVADRDSDESPWDLAHQLEKMHSEIVYAEPDLSHMEYSEKALAELNSNGRGYDESWGYPKTPIFAWHLDRRHSQLDEARKSVGDSEGKKVRIAHFDTGYDPNHISTPKYLCADLQKNFVKGENENSAVDPGTTGTLMQPGHGTGTLGILAGNHITQEDPPHDDYLGGSPFAEVVPVRLAPSVIHFQTSSFAKGLLYAVDIDCDVVSMSMGGVASQLWAEAVNTAYENGVVVVTAAGNNVASLPTRYLVFPARFKRVIAAGGIDFDHKPYFKEDPWFFKMQGNWGKPSLMRSAIAAYTPNMPWARMGKIDQFGWGGGTSSATPQVAAAAALWLQKYSSQQYEQPWQRVNAVRHALFSSAEKSLPDSEKYYGNGVLRAMRALEVAPKLDTEKITSDFVIFPYLELLLGWDWGRDGNGVNRQMIETELLQLEQNHATLQKLFDELESKTEINDEHRAKLQQAVIATGKASTKLISLLQK